MVWVGVGNRDFSLVSNDGTLLKHLYALGVSDSDLIDRYIAASASKIEGIIGIPLTYSSVEIYSNTLEVPINCNPTATYLFQSGWVQNDEINWANIVKTHLTKKCLDAIEGTLKIEATVSQFTDPLITQAMMLLVGQFYENRENKDLNSLTNKNVDQVRQLLSPITLHIC